MVDEQYNFTKKLNDGGRFSHEYPDLYLFEEVRIFPNSYSDHQHVVPTPCQGLGEAFLSFLLVSLKPRHPCNDPFTAVVVLVEAFVAGAVDLSSFLLVGR